MAWSWLGSPADIRSCSRYIIKHQPTLPFFITYRFLLHLEQPRKPKLCEKLQQEIPEVLRQELADLHGDGDGESDGDGEGDGDDKYYVNSLVTEAHVIRDRDQITFQFWSQVKLT